MSDDTFRHDDTGFARRRFPSGVDIDDGEARYAELVAEVIWDGLISPEGRRRLNTAQQVFQLDPARADQIERSVISAQSVYHHVKVREYDDLEEDTLAYVDSDDDVLNPRRSETMSPLAPQDDPRLSALQRRINLLETRNGELLEERTQYKAYVRELETLVTQLQEALAATLDDLDEVAQVADSQSEVPPPRPEEVSLHERSGEIERPKFLSPAQDVPPGAVASPDPDAPPIPVDVSSEGGGAPPPSEDVPLDDSLQVPPPRASQPRASSLNLPNLDGIEVLDVATVQGGSLRRDPGRIYEEVVAEPRNPKLLDELFRAVDPGDIDRRWGVAQALLFVEAATPEQRGIAESGLRPSLMRPQRAVSDEEWWSLIAHPDDEPLVGDILSAIAPAVLLGHLSNMRASIAPEVVDPGARVDPKTSTVQAVRCFAWAADVLGILTPTMFATPDEDRGADVVLNPVPVSRLGRRVLQGRDNRELTFLAGSHLNWFRREHLLGQPERSVRRLEDMFLAALMIGNPGIPMTAEVKERVEPTAKWIRPLLDDTTVDNLGECFGRFVEQGGKTNLAKWYRGVQRTGWRAGLLLCEDLSSAARALANDLPHDGNVAIDELIAYACSPQLSQLRQALGVAL